MGAAKRTQKSPVLESNGAKNVLGLPRIYYHWPFLLCASSIYPATERSSS